MLKKFTALYRCLIICLFLSYLGACSSLPPYQQISDAKQALAAAEKVISTSESVNNPALLAANQANYQLARNALQQAEKALAAQQYPAAQTWSANSQRYSQMILKRHQGTQQSNIRFRY